MSENELTYLMCFTGFGRCCRAAWNTQTQQISRTLSGSSQSPSDDQSAKQHPAKVRRALVLLPSQTPPTSPPLLRFDIGGVESERTPYWKHGIPWYCWEAISSLLNLYSYCFFDIFSYQTSLNLLSKGTSSVRNSPHFPFTCKSHEVSTYVHNTTNLHEGNFWK